MSSPADLISAIADIVSWVALIATLGFLLAAVIAKVVDGDWVISEAFVDDGPSGRMIRWFGEDGSPNEAPLLSHDERHIRPGDKASIFVRRGSPHRMRFVRASPAVHGLARVAAVLALITIVAFAVPWVMLVIEG